MVHGDAEIGSTETTPYSPLHDSTPSVARLSAPLLLAIAGSALTPLPCAFSLSGIALGTATMLAIAAANDFTSVLMVRAAARLGVSGYEEVVLAAGGRRALNCCRIALVILLFGTMCGCLAAIQETGVHAVGELASTTGSTTARWLAATEGGRALLLVTITVAVLLPLSLASLGELPFVSSVGVCLMVGVAGYVLFAATSVGADYDEDEAASVASSAAASLPSSWLGVARAASTFGYAFYVQPCAVPLLRTVPAGEHGVQALVWALHLTFALTTLTYLTVGLGGLVAFSAGGVPQNLLQGFPGRMGGVLAGVFCAYLMLCFSPTVIPLRETLVRLYYESSMSYFVSLVTPRPQRAEVHITPDGSEVQLSRTMERAVPPPRPAVLPLCENIAVTGLLVGCALAVALMMPNASAQIFALTGATGVCAIGYIFPVYSFWCLPPELGGAPMVFKTWSAWAAARAWPFFVLSLGTIISLLTLVAELVHMQSEGSCDASG